MKHSEITTLLNWLRALPADLLRTQPRLCLFHAWALTAINQLDTAEVSLQDAERVLREAMPQPMTSAGSSTDEKPAGIQHLLGEVAAIRASIASLRGDVPRTIECARQALERLPHENVLMRGATALSLGRAYLWSGDLVAAEQVLAEACTINQVAGNMTAALISRYSLGHLSVMQGQLHQAAEIYRTILDDMAQKEDAFPGASLVHIGMGELLYEWYELKAAEEHVLQGFELGEQWGSTGSLLHGFMCLALVKLAYRDFNGALMVQQQKEKTMNTNGKIILVTGATGHQGGASARHLQARGWHVRALTRDPHTATARALSDAGVEVAQGDLNDRASLDRALKGVYGVHSVQSYMPHDPTGEIYQGKNLAEAAKDAGVEHFVYSSVAGADQHVGTPEQDSKGEIEQYIRSSGLPATILRPTFMMETFTIPQLRQAILGGSLMLGLPPQAKLQLIASDDIGAFVALALENPQTFIGKTLELAGDELTMTQAAEVISRVIGRPVRVIEMPLEQVRSFDPNLAKVSEWIIREGFHADIPALRAMYPALMTLEDWLRKTGWEQGAQ